MKSINTSLLQCVMVLGAFLVSPLAIAAAKSTTGSDQPADPGWPREKYRNGTRLIIYQPQVDDWKDFQELTWRMAISLTPKSGKEVVGIVEMKGHTRTWTTSPMVTTDLGRAAIIDQAAATSADLAVPKCKIWTARL